jgi:hypothetical protein
LIAFLKTHSLLSVAATWRDKRDKRQLAPSSANPGKLIPGPQIAGRVAIVEGASLIVAASDGGFSVMDKFAWLSEIEGLP